ncbi:hypothetical protein CA54_42050 [Symmachiella macrocystis]|uniref:Uncharacterized protein n=1 Tax=Symmachiella macrocystis TaxID=2527985 RepID=A0A5C6BCE1_9PLAN|nr:hypothetical protein CA54_42050 [Symmachiella macrocystis]
MIELKTYTISYQSDSLPDDHFVFASFWSSRATVRY